MKKENKIIKKLYFIATFLVILLGSCSRNMDMVNTNPYLLTDSIAKRDGFNQGSYFLVLSNEVIPVQENRFQFAESMIGHPLGRYLPPTNSWRGTNFQTFNPAPSWNNVPFNDAFSNIYSAFFDIQKITNQTGVNYAWAKILRIASMQRITDMYGPIPYSKVKSGQLSAPYDSQETVYKTMIQDLTESIAELQKYVSASGNAKPMANYDNVYAGDFSKWIKFANSLKLRMAMRLVYADNAFAKNAAEEAVAGGVMESNDDNAAVKTFQKNPIFIMSGWGECRASAELVSYMKGYEDARIGKYLKQVTVNDVTDYWGTRACMIMDKATQAGTTSEPNVDKDDRLLWMPASEIAFLRAEGAIRNWNMGGDAEQFYNKGIQLSFEQWGASGADNYLNNTTATQADYTDPLGKHSAASMSTVTIKWSEGAIFENKLEKIITQKWIAMYPLGLEAWSEYRRTGYPKFFPVVNNLSSDGVSSQTGGKRLVFPESEYKNNAENVNQAKTFLKGADAQSTRLWWDAKP